jgi:hypothetical protein
MLLTNSCRHPCPIPTTSWCTTILDPSFAAALAQLVYDCPKMWDGKRERGFSFNTISFCRVKVFSECIIWESDAYPCLLPFTTNSFLCVFLAGVEPTPNGLFAKHLLSILSCQFHISICWCFFDWLISNGNDNFIIKKVESGAKMENVLFENAQSSKFFMRESLKVRVGKDKTEGMWALTFELGGWLSSKLTLFSSKFRENWGNQHGISRFPLSTIRFSGQIQREKDIG